MFVTAEQWHLSLPFSKVVEGDLPHEAGPWLVVPGPSVYSGRGRLQRPVTGSSTRRRGKHSAGFGRSVLEKL